MASPRRSSSATFSPRAGTRLSEGLIVLPELRPALARSTAEKDLRVIGAFLVLDAERVAFVAHNAAARESVVGLLLAESNHDECARRRRWIAAQPCRIGEADRSGQVVGRPQQLDGALLAVVANDNAEIGSLIGG